MCNERAGGGRVEEREWRFESAVEIRISNLENRQRRESLVPDTRSTCDGLRT